MNDDGLLVWPTPEEVHAMRYGAIEAERLRGDTYRRRAQMLASRLRQSGPEWKHTDILLDSAAERRIVSEIERANAAWSQLAAAEARLAAAAERQQTAEADAARLRGLLERIGYVRMTHGLFCNFNRTGDCDCDLIQVRAELAAALAASPVPAAGEARHDELLALLRKARLFVMYAEFSAGYQDENGKSQYYRSEDVRAEIDAVLARQPGADAEGEANG